MRAPAWSAAERVPALVGGGKLTIPVVRERSIRPQQIMLRATRNTTVSVFGFRQNKTFMQGVRDVMIIRRRRSDERTSPA
jgi:hypothetical protein